MTELEAMRERAERAERERDLAIAHDRQHYPTADAYERACAARAKWQERAESAESASATLRAERDAATARADELETTWVSPKSFADCMVSLTERADRAESALSEARTALATVRSLAQEYATLAGRNMTYEMKRPRDLLDPNPARLAWRARETTWVRWPARFAQQLRSALSSSPSSEGREPTKDE